MITLKVQTDGVVREIQTIAESLEDLEAPLAVWSKCKRKAVDAIFKAGGPGWKKTGGAAGMRAAAASGNEEAVKQLADHMLRRKLRNELKRAQRKYIKSGRAEAMERRYAVLQEFERLAAGGNPGASPYVGAKLEKSIRGLRERHARATKAAQETPLGRIASSIRAKASNTTVEIWSEIPWAGAHNDGAVVGHGAKLPKRTFLEITDEDEKMLVTLIEEHVRSRGT